tara:strand:- start:277 stop:474 length:198 start_codon:yes stop_codon:yes gene_type:complete
MKNWFTTLVLNGILTSKKFWYAIGSVVIPVIMTKLGVDEQTATNLFWALIALTGAQGLADMNKKS